MNTKATPRPFVITTQAPRPPGKPYILCIGKRISLALTAEKYGFVLRETQKGGKR